jgi:hypothetical protein
MLYTRKVLAQAKSLIHTPARFASGTKLEKFNWEDPIDLQGKLTEEE